MSEELKAQARKLMVRTFVGQCVDKTCNEVNCTLLAEKTAQELNYDDWLDDETHWIWELAVEIGATHERMLAKLAELKSNAR